MVRGSVPGAVARRLSAACSGAQKTAFVGECDQLEPGAEFQLVQHAAEVSFDGGFGDEQALRHFTIAEAFGRELKDVALPHGQDVEDGQVRARSGNVAGGMLEERVDASSSPVS
jgi:hypothetical protein